MKGRTRTKADRELHDKIAGLGCIACHLDGRYNPVVSIHHVDGRTKPDAHKKVLPLCGPHHQHDDTDPAGRIGVHPYKARFEAMYGTQDELLKMCSEKLQGVCA
jgi:hypothetical protein